MGEPTLANPVGTWGFGKMPDGPQKRRYYDKYGRTFVLPADPHSIDRYLGRGLGFTPPESPIPLVEDAALAETRQGTGVAAAPKKEVASITERLARIGLDGPN